MISPAVRRTLFHLTAAASLMLCVATLTLWLRSYWRVDAAHLYPSPSRSWIVRSAGGRLYAEQTLASNGLWDGVPNRYWSSDRPPSGGGGFSLPVSPQLGGLGYYNHPAPFAGTALVGARAWLVPHA